jgi:hypothetical protein
LDALTRAAVDERRSTADLLRVLVEVDRRALYRAEACSSMFEFMTERLHYAEGAAATRIRAARTAARFPLLFELVEGGDIHLAGIQRLAAHLTEENHVDVLFRARRKGVRDIERLVAELCPKPDIPSSLRKMPARTGPARSAAPDPTRGNVKSSRPAPRRSETLVPLAPARYSLRVTLAEEAADHLRQLQDLLAHAIPSRDPAEIMARALKGLLRDTYAKKAALTDSPRAARAAGRATTTRHIAAAVKRQVFTRDNGQCTYRDDRGRRCTSRSFIEFHHRQNFARGGTHEASNLELRCRVHNAFQAELDYGRDCIERA